MKKLEQLKTVMKLFAIGAMVVGGKKVAESLIPKSPVVMRKLLIIAGTVLIVDAIDETILGYIDKRFHAIVSEVEADAIGMVG